MSTSFTPAVPHYIKNYFATSQHFKGINPYGPDFEFQERTRTLAAQSYPKEDSYKGWYGMNAICQLLPEYQDKLSPGLSKLTRETIEKSKGQEFVKNMVNDIWRYPATSYFSFVPFSTETSKPILTLAQTTMEKNKIFPKLVFEKNTLWVRFSGLGAALHEAIDFSSLDGITGWKPNVIDDHISIFPSSVLRNLDSEKLKAFLDKVLSDPGVDISFTGFSHTFSFDWLPATLSAVLNVESKKVQEVIQEFNQTFGQKQRVQTHITIAIVPRV